MPTDATGIINPDEVQLSFTPTSTSREVRIERVDSSSACTAAGGFYYDDNETPRRILMCPTSCEAFRAQNGGTVDILLGCKGS